MVACSGLGSAPAAQGLGTTPGTPQESPNPRKCSWPWSSPKAGSKSAGGRGSRRAPWSPAKPRDRSVHLPSTKTPLFGSQLGALAPTEYPQVWQGKDQHSPQGGCGSRPLSGWSGLPPGRDMTQGGLPFPGQGLRSSSPPTGCLGPSHPERVSTPRVGGAAGTVGGQEGCLIEVGKLEGPSVG